MMGDIYGRDPRIHSSSQYPPRAAGSYLVFDSRYGVSDWSICSWNCAPTEILTSLLSALDEISSQNLITHSQNQRRNQITSPSPGVSGTGTTLQSNFTASESNYISTARRELQRTEPESNFNHFRIKLHRHISKRVAMGRHSNLFHRRRIKFHRKRSEWHRHRP